MKNIFRSTLIASLFVGTAMAGGWTVVTGDLTFQGYGQWRSTSGSHGLYTTYEKTWPQCYYACMSNSVCTGVEFNMKANGQTSCEVHRGEYQGLTKGQGHSTIWTK